ncbi:unnamed protein product [Bursaphelenchus xylophilus]|uniref:(pine wood nematode) hypothetical protein n=1 Tax=Bursaphelenchus xylophilus TaxID=6326 RepID=A0A1I7S3B5_BURXY|nr:unnamed protein product [Bursaphelenchus xylophilus]CAG9116192.1 unnamed protein product [Bursaphelenchus xylophilus]
MLKEIILIILLGFVLSQLAKSQTTGSYWGFDPNEQTTTQNWWGENVDTGELPEASKEVPDTTPLPTAQPQVAAAGVAPVGASDSTDSSIPTTGSSPVEGENSERIAPSAESPPVEATNSTSTGITTNLLWIPLMGFVVFN